MVLSTFHKAKMETKEIRGREKKKPEMIFSYNKSMGGVDLSDKKTYHYASERATHRYWVKIFANLLDIAMLNSYELYQLRLPTTTRSKQKYIQSIIYSLCGQGRRPPPTPPAPATPTETPTDPIHRLEPLPGKKESDCAVCSRPKARKRSRTWCPICQVGVHKACEPFFPHPGFTKRRGTKRTTTAT